MRKRININQLNTLLLDDISQSDFFLDLGANVGNISSLVLNEVTVPTLRIIAFEPDPDALIHLNKLEDDRLSIIESAAWITDGEMTLFRHRKYNQNNSHTSSSLIPTKSNVSEEFSIVVNTVNFVRFLSKQDISNAVIKMDIEGAEYKILFSMLKMDSFTRVNRIYCEFHANSIRFGYCYHILLKVRLLMSGNSRLVRLWY
jgi:FkbM family methyltransferase